MDKGLAGLTSYMPRSYGNKATAHFEAGPVGLTFCGVGDDEMLLTRVDD